LERPRLRRLLRHLADTEDQEISCDECFDLVSQYVDLEITGAVADRTLSQLRQHLQQCGVCQEEYEVLRDLAQLDKDGRGPSSDDWRSTR
jgi:hypothetical protein